MLPQQVASLVDAMLRAAEQLARLDPADVPASLAAELVTRTARATTLAESTTALLARRVETSGVWQEAGARSSASWLAHEMGMSQGQAVQLLAAGRVVEQHPEFEPGFRSGATTVRHLDAVRRTLGGHGHRAVERNRCFPPFAAALATVAEHTDALEFSRAMREWADAVDHAPSGRELEAIESRFLTFTELDGVCHLTAALPLLEGRLLRRRLEALVDAHIRHPAASPLAGRRPAGRGDDPHAGPAGEGPPRRSALLLDALLALADIADAHPGAMPLLDGQPAQVLVVVPGPRLRDRRGRRAGPRPPDAAAPPGIAPPDRDSRDPHPHDPDPLDPDPPAPRVAAASPPLVPPALLIVGGEPTPVDDATARWASCGDAEVRRLVLDADGIVTDLGRRARVASRDLRLRIALRDRWCRFPGCRVPAMRCQAHHLTHWADGGQTRVEELYCLCRHHHRVYHQREAMGLLRVTGAPEGDLHFWNGAVALGTTRPLPLHRVPRSG